jgi:N-acetylmuramoyl-L-alanine amidase
MRRPRVMLNPSCQYGNRVLDASGRELYNEGKNLWHFAVEARKALEEDGRVEAFISRESQDSPSGLDAEADLTNRLGCDCLVALHSDATADGSPGGGTWTFYTGESHLSAEELAALPYPLADSRRLAELVHGAVLEEVRTVYPEVRDRGVREHWHRLRMLHAPRCPSCLIEILFHTNPRERELLKRPGFQSLVGKAVARGVLKYLFGE